MVFTAPATDPSGPDPPAPIPHPKRGWSKPLHWLADFSDTVRRRLKPQRRLLGLALVVGIVAGLGAVLFYAAGQAVFHYTLDAVAGYHPEPTGGEIPALPGNRHSAASLVAGPDSGTRRPGERLARVFARAGSRRPRHRFGRLPHITTSKARSARAFPW